jgi:hypothetical protein
VSLPLHPACLIFQLSYEVEFNLRPTVSRPVRPGVRRPSGTRDKFFFLLEISFRQLWLCYFVVPSLTRGQLCNLSYNCFWALPEQSLLGRSPAELTAIFYCPTWDSPSLEDQVPVFISPRTGVTQLYPRALEFSFCHLLWLAGQRWRYSNLPPHGLAVVWLCTQTTFKKTAFHMTQDYFGTQPCDMT